MPPPLHQATAVLISSVVRGQWGFQMTKGNIIRQHTVRNLSRESRGWLRG